MKNFNRYLTKEDIWIANKDMKGCTTSLVCREIQIKTTRGYHYILTRMAFKIELKYQVLLRKQSNSQTLLMGMQNTAATWKTVWPFV